MMMIADVEGQHTMSSESKSERADYRSVQRPSGDIPDDRSRLEDELARMEQEQLALVRRAHTAEQETRAAREQLASVFERVTDAFVALDKDGRYLFVNAKAAELLARRPEELIGKHVLNEFPDEFGPRFRLAYERAVAEQSTVHIEQNIEKPINPATFADQIENYLEITRASKDLP